MTRTSRLSPVTAMPLGATRPCLIAHRNSPFLRSVSQHVRLIPALVQTNPSLPCRSALSSSSLCLSERQAAADEWAAVESNEPQARAQSPKQITLPQKAMARMSDHVADDASFESDEDDDSSSPSDTTSSSNLPIAAGDAGPGTSGSSGGPYSALTRSLGFSPRGEGGVGAFGKSFHQQQQLSSDSDGLSSRDSPPKRPRDMHAHNPAQYDSSDDGEIEFG